MLRPGQRIVKHKATGRLYSVVTVMTQGIMAEMLSAYDGMPMGLPQYLLYDEVD